MRADKKVFTTFDAAEYCSVHDGTIRNWVEKGMLKSYKTPGGHRRIRKEDLDAFLAKMGMPAGAVPVNVSPRILIVDDNVEVLKTIEKFLAAFDEDFEVATAENGFDAGRQIDRFNPDLVILDLRMPGMDGFQVCSNLKLDPNTSHIKVLAITGYYSSLDARKIKECGAEHCLTKPLDLFELKDWIVKLLGLSRSLSIERQKKTELTTNTGEAVGN